MTKTVSFEIYTFKDGKWQMNAVFNDKDEATSEARKLFDVSKNVVGVKVLQEEYDSEENRSSTHVIYNEMRGAKKSPVKAAKEEQKEPAVMPKATRMPEKKGSFTQYLLYMILGVGAVFLAILGIAAYYMKLFK